MLTETLVSRKVLVDNILEKQFVKGGRIFFITYENHIIILSELCKFLKSSGLKCDVIQGPFGFADGLGPYTRENYIRIFIDNIELDSKEKGSYFRSIKEVTNNKIKTSSKFIDDKHLVTLFIDCENNEADFWTAIGILKQTLRKLENL